MIRRATIALTGLVFVVVGAQGCKRREPPPLGLEADSQGPLTFPPPEQGWTDRAPLPSRAEAGTLRTDRAIHLSSPTIKEGEKSFSFEGQVLRLYFTDSLFDPNAPKKAPELKITPAVKGKTVWDAGNSVEFRADGYFDPDTEYTLTIPEMTGPSGKKFAGLMATFKATPAITIAGKTIRYVPKAGEARVVAILPNDESKIGGAQEVTVIYDQAVDLTLAKQLVTLSDEQGGNIAANYRHPAGNTFEGEKVDPRFLVLVKPTIPRKPDEKFTLKATAQKGDDEAKTSKLTVAEPTKLTDITCGGNACASNGNTQVKGPSTSSLQVKYSNPLGLGWEDGKKVVHITPQPKNLWVNAYDNLSISGSFAPSTTYSVRIDAIRDQYGGTAPAHAFTFTTQPLPSSATMTEGVSLLDEASVKSFAVTTRNVEEGAIELWALPKGDANAFAQALKDIKTSTAPEAAPVTVTFTPGTKRDEFVDTVVDLDTKLERGRAYVARTKIVRAVTDAEAMKYPTGSDASRPAMAVLFPAGPNALGAHVHQTGEKAVVQVFRLASGEPESGAKVTIGGNTVTTDASGSALVAVPPAPAPGVPANELAVAVATSDAELMMPIAGSMTIGASSLFPELAPGGDVGRGDLVGMVVTDRGVYRPGTKMQVKAYARKMQDGGVKAMPKTKVHVRLVDPTDSEVFDEVLETNDRGAVNKEIALDKAWHTGRFHLRLELDDERHTQLADELVRIAAFETPKFKVDVENAAGSEALAPTKIKARITGRYLFGAPMSDAHVNWVVKKAAVPVKGGALADAGLVFGREYDWWNERPADESLRPVTGEATLATDGTFVLDAETGPLAEGPTEVTVEADVNDASNRHISGQWHTTKDPFAHHAGLKLSRRFGEAGKPLHVDLGVVDPNGNALAGIKVGARIERLKWTRTAVKAESGATVERWMDVATVVGQCEVTTDKKPVGCDVPVETGGSYRVVVQVDGRDDASESFWAYGNWSPGERPASPSAGKKVPLVLDKAKYKGGETAKLLVQSPYDKAIALLTVEQGGILRHESKRIEGPSATFDVPVSGANAPWLNAAVTLLPIGESEADYRVAASRVAVDSDSAKLDVKVASHKKQYEVGDEVEVSIDVKRGDAPAKNTDVTLAVVDEGVLRMTGFHAKDPSHELHPGRGLDFRLTDSRAAMLKRREKAHVAGGGDGTGEDSLDTRKNFVETAAWMPSLVTDDKGHVTAKFKLPDNLTEFRMMAVVVDDAGGGGSAESSFTVSKSLMLEPVMPRFALRGDTFEAAAMVHNNTDAPVSAKVTVADQLREVTVPGRGRQRVSVPMTADRRGTRTMRFALEANGKARDKVEIPLRIDDPGVDEHPLLSGIFADKQEIHVEIPADAIYEEGAALSIKTGSALYPELGQRLGYLLDYPHGCVEQTTSSTLPLIAARTLLPWTGAKKMDDAELKKRIQVGVDRLATMQTSVGGLAYWPGGGEPNLYGSAYALEALVRAKEIGIEKPKLIDAVGKYLAERVENESEPELRVSIASSLARTEYLPASSADGLYDLREKVGPFGLASLALALQSIPNQDDRVKDVLDRLEASFDEKGATKHEHGEKDWYWWGSNDRDRAQAVITLKKLRPTSHLLPVLAARLARHLESWTTQSTAWSLVALSDFVEAKSPNGAVDVDVKLEGKIVDTFERLGGDNKEVRIPLKDLAGKKVTLLLSGDAKAASAFALEATYKRPFDAAGGRIGRRAAEGPSIHRAYSDAKGKALDLQHVKAGDVVRVALRIELPQLDTWRLGYIAITDRLPAGLEPIDTDLATSGSVPDLDKEHPYYDGLTSYGPPASHVDLRDDKVQLYFDRIYGGRVLYATYLTRATTPGTFAVPPTSGELMYEPDSDGYSDVAKMTVQ